MITKICEYCGKEFEAKRSTRMYCYPPSSCKTFASQVNTGKRKPLHKEGEEKIQLTDEEVQEIEKRLIVLCENIELEKQQYSTLIETLIPNKNSSRIEEEIGNLDALLHSSEPNSKEEDEYSKSIERLEKELQEIEEYNNRLPSLIRAHEAKIERALVSMFRAKETRDDFVKANIMNSNEVKGSAINGYKKFKQDIHLRK